MNTSEIKLRANRPERRVYAVPHRFAEGQVVRLRNAYVASGNVYLITASLPPLGASPQYRIRNEAEKFERMATEADLELVTATAADRGRAHAERLFESR